MDRKEFIDFLLTKKVIDKEVIKFSKNISDFPLCYKVLLAIDGNDFIQTILQSTNPGEIDLAGGDLKKFCILNNKDIKEVGTKFINDLVKRSIAINSGYSYFGNGNRNNPNPLKRKVIIGIDLGTTNTVASFVENDLATTILLKNGSRLLPSVVAINKNSTFDVGEKAKRQLIINPNETFFSIKRFIGRRTSEFTQKFLKNYPFKMNVDNEKIMLTSDTLNSNFQCEEISGQILLKIKTEAELFLDATIEECVITVPAYFDSSQRLATKNAAKIAGMEVIKIINEPTAAAFAYQLEKKGKEENTLVLDLGGGTFDISLVRTVGDNLDNFSVVCSLGDRELGGDDYTNIISEIIKNYLIKENSNLLLDKVTLNLIRDESQKAKHILSQEDEVEIHFPFLPTKNNEIFSTTYILKREKFEKESEKITNKIKNLIEVFLEKVKKEEISNVVLVGGASRMTIFKDLVAKIIQIEPKIDINPDEVVAHGAAYCAQYLFNCEHPKIVIDVNPLALGTEVDGDLFAEVLPANIPLPAKRSEPFTTVDDYQRIVNIDVLQGGLHFAKQNIKLGNCILDDIEIGRKGTPSIEITFELDEDGLLSMSAIDRKTLSKVHLEMSDTLNIPKEVIDQMRKLANNLFNES